MQLVANPTLARRDGGWSWLVWSGLRADERWAHASDELDALLASARAGASREALIAAFGADVVDAIVEAGVLSYAATYGPPAGELGRQTVQDLSSELVAAHGDREIALLDALDAGVGPAPVLAGLEIAAPTEPVAAPPRSIHAIVADVAIPGGPAPTSEYAIALAPMAERVGVVWLALDDLRVSLVDDHLVLRSVSLGRSIIPRLHRARRPDDPALLRLLHSLSASPGAAAFPVRDIPAVCSLGSEWLDLKLATTPRRADSVLVDLVAPFVAKMGIEQWHFLRYPEPRFHLRVRFHGEPRALVREVLPAFSDVAQGWLADGRLSDLQVGSYYREVERFGGGDGVQWIEQLFSADSVCVAGLCEWLRDQDDPEDARWRACALGIAQLARDLVPDPQSLLAALRDDFRRRVGLRGLSDQLPRLEARLASSSDLEQPRAIFRARSARIAEIAPRLRTTGLSRPVVAIAAACVHLFTNRLLRNDALHQELVLYELLARLNCSDSSA